MCECVWCVNVHAYSYKIIAMCVYRQSAARQIWVVYFAGAGAGATDAGASECCACSFDNFNIIAD